MKTKIILTLASLALLFACQSQEMVPQGPEDNGVSKTVTQREVIITADIAEGAESIDQTTRTSVAFQGTQLKTFWSPGDPINIFSLGVSTMFTSTNTEPARKAQFRGTVTVVVGDDGESGINYLWGLYPYNADAVYSEPDGNSATAVITTSVPDLQRGKADTFDNGVATMIGRSESFTINYKNAYSGVYVRFNKDDVISVTLKGLHGETLAGKATFGLDTDMNPVVVGEVQNPKTAVTVYAPDGGTFESGKNYFMVTLPDVALEEGYSLTVKRLGGIEATFNSLTTVKSLDRNVFKTFNNPLDTYIENATNISNGRSTGWINSSTATAPGPNEIWYTTSDGEAVNYSLDGKSGNEFDGGVLAPKDNGGVGIVRFTAPVTKVDDEAFAQRANLTSVSLPDCVETIGTSAFEYCENLTTVHLGSSLKTIGEWAFGTCGFETIDFLPEGLLNIGAGAFSDCVNLTSVMIPTSVTNIQYHSSSNLPMGSPFYGSTSIESFSGKFATSDGKALVAQGTDGRNYLVSIAYAAFDAEDTFVVPEGVTAIAHFACWTASFGQVVLPETLTAIRDAAFSGCVNLTSLTIPASLSTIGCLAFNNCKNLEWVSIETPSVPGVTGTYYNTGGMFNGSSCPINVPDELVDEYKTTAYWSDYEGRYNFVEKESDKFIYYTTTDGEAVDYHVNSATGNQLDGDIVAPKDNGGVGVIKFKHAITTIDNSAFYGSENLQSVTLPDCVVKLGDNSFRNCENLMDVNLGTGLTMIGRYAFAECNFVEVDFLPAGLKRIGAFAFQSCPNLLEVTIPESVEFLGYYSDSYSVPLGNPFLDCPKLQRFNGKFATQDGRGLVMVKDNVRYFMSFATYGMDYSSYTVPAVDYISFYAFYGSTLAQVQLPDCLAVISDRAFMDSQILTSITIPSGVEVVGGESFAGCYSLERITINTPYVPDAFRNPCYVKGGMFNGSYCPIFVPSTVLSSYLGAQYWMDYAERLRANDGASGTFAYTSPYESGENW